MDSYALTERKLEDERINKAQQDKLDYIQEYIDTGEKLIACYSEEIMINEDDISILSFCRECFSVFNSEILEFERGIFDPSEKYNITHIKLLIQKLKKYKIDFNLRNKNYAITPNNPVNFYNQNTNSNSIEINVNITNTIYKINKITNSELTAEEKVKLQELLFEIEELKDSKDKKSLWDKIKSVGIWVLEKGLETTLATLPYLLGIME